MPEEAKKEPLSPERVWLGPRSGSVPHVLSVHQAMRLCLMPVWPDRQHALMSRAGEPRVPAAWLV